MGASGLSRLQSPDTRQEILEVTDEKISKSSLSRPCVFTEPLSHDTVPSPVKDFCGNQSPLHPGIHPVSTVCEMPAHRATTSRVQAVNQAGLLHRTCFPIFPCQPPPIDGQYFCMITWYWKMHLMQTSALRRNGLTGMSPMTYVLRYLPQQLMT